MGLIMRNGVAYGGSGTGGDNSVTLTKAEYDALSEEDQNNGTTYYVTDEGGSGGGSDVKVNVTVAEGETVTPLENIKVDGAIYNVDKSRKMIVSKTYGKGWGSHPVNTTVTDSIDVCNDFLLTVNEYNYGWECLLNIHFKKDAPQSESGQISFVLPEKPFSEANTGVGASAFCFDDDGNEYPGMFIKIYIYNQNVDIWWKTALQNVNYTDNGGHTLCFTVLK